MALGNGFLPAFLVGLAIVGNLCVVPGHAQDVNRASPPASRVPRRIDLETYGKVRPVKVPPAVTEWLVARVVERFAAGDITMNEAASRLVGTGLVETQDEGLRYLNERVVAQIEKRRRALQADVADKQAELELITLVLAGQNKARDEIVREAREGMAPQGARGATEPQAATPVAGPSLPPQAAASPTPQAQPSALPPPGAGLSGHPYWLVEANVLPLVDGGVGAEIEGALTEDFTIGAVLQTEERAAFDNGGVKSQFSNVGGGLKVRYYPGGGVEGPFFGAKLLFGQNEATVKDGFITTTRKQNGGAITVHGGVRLLSSAGFTLTGYVGGGVNLRSAKFDRNELKPQVRDDERWKRALDALNRENARYRQDLGLTLGYHFR